MSVIVKFLGCSRVEVRAFLKCPGWEERGRRGFKPKGRPQEDPIPRESLNKGPKLELEDVAAERASWSVLVRPAVFTAVFCGGTMAGCAVWQYENMRSAALTSKVAQWGQGVLGNSHRKAGAWREKVRAWWAVQEDGEKLFWPLAGLNLLVWCAWRVPVLQGAMYKWFTGNPVGKATCLPLLLSTFSHHSFFHLAANMFVLHSFMGPSVHILGKEQFLAVYLSAGVASSFGSMVHKVAVGKSAPSLGASGAICTVLGMFATLVPHAHLNIIFLPMFTFTAASALKAMMMMDTAGMVLGWKVFDHAAHLSGLVLGVWWCYFGNPRVWEQREGVVTAWHNLRDRNKRD